jgi:peptidoglycan/xylan/chitin deacetylase (PgdA/CDA1 family)
VTVSRSTSKGTTRRCRRSLVAGTILASALVLLSSGIARNVRAEPLTAAILRSDYTYGHIGQQENWRVEDAVSRWQKALSKSNISHQLITDSQLEAGDLSGINVLILPIAICLSEDEKNSIRSFLDDAGGIVSTGPLGTRDEKGNPAGWDFLEEMTSSLVADSLGRREGLWAVLTGNSPLTIGIAPGFRMELYSWRQLALIKGTRDAYWSDWSMEPQKITEDPYSDVAIIHGPKGNGRTVWFGFNTTELIDEPENEEALQKLLINSAMWAGRAPMARIWYWPDNHLATAVFTQDVEDQFANAQRSVDVLRREGIPGTFFCVTDLAVNHPALVKSFAEIGEVGSHTDDHRVCQGQPYELQHERLGKSVEALKHMCDGYCVRSFRPPEELMDESTFKAWADLGGRYIFGEAGLGQQAPGVFNVALNSPESNVREIPMVVIPRLVKDDYSTMITEALDKNEDILAAHIKDLNRVYKLSGLYMFAYHSQYYCLPERIEVLSSMAKYAKTLDLWFATVGQVSDWWLKRSKISTEIDWATYRSLTLKVGNSNPEPVSNASVKVYLPGAPDGVEIVSDSPENPSPDYFLEKDRLILFPHALEPNSTRTYTITLQ